MFKKSYLKPIFCLILVFSLFQINTGMALVGNTDLTKTSLNVDRWNRVEKGLENPSNFAYGGVIPEFNMDNSGVIEFNSGHALSGSDYEGYYWKLVDLKGDFELVYKAMTYTGNTDSNFAFVSLADNKSNEVYNFYKKDDQTSVDSTQKANVFYSYLSPGRSWWTSLYGSNQGGPGFPLIGATVRGEGIDRYDYSAYDKYLGDNKYGFQHEANEEYIVKMSRKSNIFYFSITNSNNELVHEWKLEDKHNVHFRYLSIGMGNTDDLDSPIGSQKGKIWDIKLSTETDITPNPGNEDEAEVETEGLVYKSLLPLLGVQKLVYKNFSDKVYYINTKAELKKYSHLVELAGGNIIIGQIAGDSNTDDSITKNIFPQEIIKKKDSQAVYYVDNKKKELKAIINPAGLKKVADIPVDKEIDWNIVKEVSGIEFDKYSDYSLGKVVGEDILDYQDGDLVKSEKDNKVYLVEQGQKKHIKNEKVFDQMGFNWDKIKTLSELLIQSLEVGKEIDIEDSSSKK